MASCLDDAGQFLHFVHEVLSDACDRLVDEKWLSFQLDFGFEYGLSNIVRGKLDNHASRFTLVFV